MVLAGGFVITDRRDDLALSSSVADEISFDSPEEMQFKLDYFLNSKNFDRYLEVKNTIYNEFKDKFSYQKVCQQILRTFKVA